VLVSSPNLAASTNNGASALISDEGIDTGRSAAWYASGSSTMVPTPAIWINTRSATAIRWAGALMVFWMSERVNVCAAELSKKRNRHSSGYSPVVVAKHSSEALSALNRVMG
jgi:hypothetical protein